MPIDEVERKNTQTEIMMQLAQSAVSTPRKPAEEYGFWENIEPTFIPKRVDIATSSPRKVVLIALQLLLLNEQEFPKIFQRFDRNVNPLPFLAFLKSVFENKNNELTEEVYLGHAYGVDFYACPTMGEKHDAGLTQLDEAVNKAKWLILHNQRTVLEYLLQKAQRTLTAESLTQEQAEDYFKRIVIGLDTLDEMRSTSSTTGEQTLIRMPKPMSDPELPKDWRDNPEAFRQYKLNYIQRFFPEGATLTGKTAVVAFDALGLFLASGDTAVSTTIEVDKVMAEIEQMDPGASYFGVLQLLMDFEKMQDQAALMEDRLTVDKMLSGTDEQALHHLMNDFIYADKQIEGMIEKQIHEYVLSFPQEKRAMASFHLLAQIMGTPMWMMLKVIQAGLQHRTQEYRMARMQTIFPAAPVEEGERVSKTSSVVNSAHLST